MSARSATCTLSLCLVYAYTVGMSKPVTMAVRFTDAEAATIDAVRGDASRSDWLREVAVAAAGPIRQGAQPTHQPVRQRSQPRPGPPPGLPDAAELLEAARAAALRAVPVMPADPEKAARALERRHRAASRALSQWAPDIDELTDLDGAAGFLRIPGGGESLRREMHRKRADGTPRWPAPDHQAGRYKSWSYRTIVLARAFAPGRGAR